MPEMNFENHESEPVAPVREEGARKPYLKPHLEELGDLRDLTLGPSPGAGESGNPFVFHSGT
jgi:hypothetical protein